MSAPSERGHASILLKMAAMTIAAARVAWTDAKDSTDATVLRSAYRACVLAARSAHNSAATWAHDSRGPQLATKARQIDAAASELLSRLARVA